jgi:hypothetical protein
MLFRRAFRVKGIESIYPGVVRDIAPTCSWLSMDLILLALPMDKGYKRPSRNILVKGMTSLSGNHSVTAGNVVVTEVAIMIPCHSERPSVIPNALLSFRTPFCHSERPFCHSERPSVIPNALLSFRTKRGISRHQGTELGVRRDSSLRSE